MTKKAIKHIKKKINKKQVKQSLRANIKQQKTTNKDVVNGNVVSSNAVDQNSVRNQLLMRTTSDFPMSVGVGNDAVFDMQR